MGDRDRRGGLEGLSNGGELSSQEDCDTIRRTSWVQVREGNRDINLVSEVGASVGGDRARTAVPGFSGRMEGV